MNNIFLNISILVVIMMLAPTGVSAQVVIGDRKTPEDFSALELVSNSTGGMRLPQMTTSEREAMEQTAAFQAEKEGEAMGLRIFNTDTRCVETWNGFKWISECAPVICADLPAAVSFCNTGSTIADMRDRFGISQWYATAVGGQSLAVSTVLTHGKVYYADNCADQSGRKAVTVSLVDCSAINTINAKLTAFVNVMYDFQHQTIEAYTTSGGNATAWQWQVSTSSAGAYTDIPGATSATFTIPENFINNEAYAAAVNDELFFRCKMTNPSTPNGVYTPNPLGIEFIRTNTEGYGEENGVRYLTIERSSDGVIPANDKVRIALLNLGQGEGGDAGDLGDLYQWGRIADGHQKAVWGKNPATKVNMLVAGTSAIVSQGTFTLTASGQVDPAETNYIDKFITVIGGSVGTGNDDWSVATTQTMRWGNGPISRTDAPVYTSDWIYPENNPAPVGWRVPSRYDLFDIYRVSSNGDPVYAAPSYGSDAKNNNLWRWRSADTNANAYGGVVISNAAGEKVFLPANGFRGYTNGLLSSGGSSALLWSSTEATGLESSFYLNSSAALVSSSGLPDAYAMPIRPIADCPEGAVCINGVCWAKTNVGAPGTFAATPESPGMLYQWNRKTAWFATGTVTGWDTSYATADTWDPANDPSPEGWRVPTMEELQTLYDKTKVSLAAKTINGVNGIEITDLATGASLFLPAVNLRDETGNLVDRQQYWSNEKYGDTSPSAATVQVTFSRGGINWSSIHRACALPLRPVAK